MGLYIALGVLAAVLMLGSIGWYGYMIARAVKRRRLYGRGATIASALRQPGRAARVRGKVVAIGAPLNAPLSGRPCVCFELLAEHRIVNRYYRGAGGHRVDFAVVDDTGRAGVVAHGIAKLELADDYIAYERGTPEADRLGRRLVELGVAAPDEDGEFRAMTIIERILAEGERVEIEGVVTEERDPDPSAISAAHGYRDAPVRGLIAACSLRALRDTGRELRAVLPSA